MFLKVSSPIAHRGAVRLVSTLHTLNVGLFCTRPRPQTARTAERPQAAAPLYIPATFTHQLYMLPSPSVGRPARSDSIYKSVTVRRVSATLPVRCEAESH